MYLVHSALCPCCEVTRNVSRTLAENAYRGNQVMCDLLMRLDPFQKHDEQRPIHETEPFHDLL